MKVVVGLGNPGEEHKNNRHNVGFMVVDRMYNVQCTMYKLPLKFTFEKKFEAEICKIDNKLLLIKPQAFMNNSGKSVQAILQYYKVKNMADLIVVHDDLDLELGRVKVEQKGGISGHHGIESIINETGRNDFVKVRVGIGRPQKKGNESCYYDITKNYLLSNFTPEEQEKVKNTIIKTLTLITNYIKIK
ncbi:aminoacyl-tRNA hydrolase [Candidatus Microgenomates bacterium]|nr:aminoacyl-tRNA hydrolase [Candidatus Microgenomates bacterium]